MYSDQTHVKPVSSSQSISTRPAPPVSLPPTLHRSSPATAQATEAPARPGSPVRSNPRRLPAKTPAAVKAQDEGNERGSGDTSGAVSWPHEPDRCSKRPKPKMKLVCRQERGEGRRESPGGCVRPDATFPQDSTAVAALCGHGSGQSRGAAGVKLHLKASVTAALTLILSASSADVSLT